MKQCSTRDPNPRIVKILQHTWLAWLDRQRKEWKQSFFFLPAFKQSNKTVLKMLIHKAVHLTCASFALIKQHELVKLPSTCDEKLFNIWWEGRLCNVVPRDPAATHNIPPLSLSTGWAKNLYRHNRNYRRKREKKNKHSSRQNQTCRLTWVNEVSITDLGITSRHPLMRVNIRMAFASVYAWHVCPCLQTCALLFCPLPPPPPHPAIITVSLVIKKGEREVGREVVGGEKRLDKLLMSSRR